MTERTSRRAATSSRGRGGAFIVAYAAVATFLAVLTLLALRLSTGQDPALRANAAMPPAHRVLVRRIIERRVVVHVPPTVPAPANSTSQQVSSAGGDATLAPTTRTS